MKSSVFSCAARYIVAAVCLIASLGAEARAQDLLLWNGEGGSASSTTFYFGSAVSAGTYAGSWSFEGVPDAWHEPGISLNNQTSWRVDLSTYKELRFYARANQVGKTLDFKMYGWPNFSRQVNIDRYIDGGKLDTQWRLVRIPIDSLKTAAFPLNKVEILYFGVAKPSTGHKIYIDEIHALASLPAPVISVTPALLGFGNQQVGTSATQTLQVANTGNASLTVTGIAVSGNNAAEFSPSPTSFNVAPGASQIVSITFAPQAAGSRSATLSLSNNDLSHNPTQVSAAGTGTVPDIALVDSALDFGGVMLGQSASRTLTVANTGAAALVVNNLSSSNAAFSASPSTFTVPAGGSVGTTLTFTPTAEGAASGTLTISSDDPDESTLTIPLSGAGNPALETLGLWNGEGGSASGATFYFGSAVSAGTYAGTWSFEGVPDPWHEPAIGLNNVASWRADLSTYKELRFYARADQVGKTLDFKVYGWPNFSRQVNIDRYIDGGHLDTQWRLVRVPIDSLKTASFPLNKVEILYFGVAKPSSGHRIYIDEVQAVRPVSSGSPPVVTAPDIAVSPASLNFGGLNVGQSSSLTLNVANSGSATLTVSGITSSEPAFAASPASLSVPAGGSSTVNVSFAPTAAGSWNGTLSISSNAPNKSPLAIAFSGSAADTTSAPPAPGPASVTGVTSSSVSLSWGLVSGATQARVYLSAEPAPVAGGSLPGQQLLASLAGTATSYRLSNLAAGVELFVRLEITTPQGVIAHTLHARTLGGPGAVLDTPLRQVCGYAPQILQLTLANPGTHYNGSSLDGNTGAQWQAGPWRVTRQDGSAIGVVQVYRHTVPVSQPSYQVGYGLPYDDNVVDVDHQLYLVLDQPIGNRELLQVNGPLGLSFTLPFSDRYLETPVIQLNQVGYHPQATRRWAYVSGWMGDGGALSLSNFPSTGEVLAEPADSLAPRNAVLGGLALTVRSANDADAGAEVRQLDLAALPPAEGVSYRVRLPGVGVSWRTAVSTNAAAMAYTTVVRGLFYRRWGADLQPQYTAWSRPADHPTVFTAEGTDATQFYPQNTPQTGQRSLVGGYHDAGDFDQRPMHVTVAQLLLRTFELNPGAFRDGALNLPESGNGIPDLLDEALWGVSGWAQLQESDGGVRLGVESWRHPWAYYHDNDDPLTYWTYAREGNHSARVAGLFAQAARLVAPYNGARATTLRGRAINAYTYAVGHGASPANLLYAAGELYRLTGDLSYKLAFETAWTAMGVYGAFSNFATAQFYMGDYFNNNRAMPDFILGYLGSSTVDAGITLTSQNWMTNYANGALASVLNSSHAHRSPRPAGQSLDWGNGITLGKYLDTLYGRLQLGGLPTSTQQDYFDALSLAADYVLGGNPDGRVYFTGLGSRPVQEPLHLDGLSFIKEGKGPIPGIAVYGPVSGVPAASYYNPAKAGFYPAFDQQPPLCRYADVRTFVVTNEFSVWESQAPQAELLAAMQGLAVSLGGTGAAKLAAPPLASTIGSGGIQLEPNHPNPFNPSTTLAYRLAEAGSVRLVVYNLLGQPVRLLVDAPQQSGDHAVQWDGRNDAGQQVASGLYFYRLQAGNNMATGKMMFGK